MKNSYFSTHMKSNGYFNISKPPIWSTNTNNSLDFESIDISGLRRAIECKYCSIERVQ